MVVEEAEQREALCDACYGQGLVAQAPLVFVFAADPTAWERDLEPIFEKAKASGAWPPKVVEYLQQAVPDFQQNLGDRNREYAIKDAMIAATHLVLAAESRGLASCFLNGWEEDAVKRVIGAGEDSQLCVAVIVPVGLAAESRSNPGRLDLEHNIFRDHLSKPYRR